ncbi:hypothetical protein [Niveispirillum sp.]|uniref:hypothetical protein n=1 Tax=Niveispirillum sp. TaxID=1917217 RepID=UPI001B49BF21|nr:hypothetical protein [Niveispirillum sp.]MBP7336878.1 hypothetical protein [Niveispirillum sp.]
MRDVTMVWLLEWAYRVQLVLEAADQGMTQAERWERGLSGPACALGAGPRVDGGAQGGAARCHGDAEAVHAAVWARTSGLARGLVLRHARTGGQPDWCPGAEVRRVVVCKPNGRPERVYDANRNFVGVKTRDAVFQGVVDTGLCPDGLALARDSWVLWADAVHRLTLHDWRLSEHRVVGAGVALRPWEGAAHEAA